jgi:hypothetical protein
MQGRHRSQNEVGAGRHRRRAPGIFAVRRQSHWLLQNTALKPPELCILPGRARRLFSTGAGSGEGGSFFDRARSFLFKNPGAAVDVAKEYPRAALGVGMAAVAIPLFALLNEREKECIEREKAYRESDIGRARMETDAILAARVPPPQADEVREYVPRLELEAALEAYLKQPSSKAGAYLVVYGARGAGKSTLVLDARLAQATKAYRAAHPDEPHWRPTVVFDIEGSSSGELIASVCLLAKQLAHDTALCHVVIVLSSSLAVVEMPADSERQTFLRVGGFSREEASTALDTTLAVLLANAVASDAAVAAVKARVLPLSTLASSLAALGANLRCGTSEPDLRARAEAWASAFEANARMDVMGALALEHITLNGRKFTVAELMRDLLDAGAPVKLPTSTYTVPARLFAAKIRESDEARATFGVDLVARTVDFATGAHRSAAAEAEAARAKSAWKS